MNQLSKMLEMGGAQGAPPPDPREHSVRECMHERGVLSLAS